MFDRISKRHCHFNVIWKHILTSLGYTEDHIFSEDIREFCCNYWIASPSLLKEYIKFLKDVRHVMETNEDVKKYLNLNSNYEKLPSKTYMGLTGKRFYMYHPFILERMPCFFVYDRKIKTVPIERLLQNNLLKPVHPVYEKKHLIVHIVNGNSIKECNLLKSFFDYVLIFTKPPELGTEKIVPFIVKNIGGAYEAWSDVVLNLQKHYKTITLSKFVDLDIVNRKTNIIIDALNRENSVVLGSFCKAELGYDETCFIFSVEVLPILKQTMFHPVYYYEKDYEFNIKKETIIELRYRGFDIRWYSEDELTIPKKLLTFNPQCKLNNKSFLQLVNYGQIPRNFLPMFEIDPEIGRYIFLYNEGGVFIDETIEESIQLDPFTLNSLSAQHDVILTRLPNGSIDNKILISKSKCEFWVVLTDMIWNIIKGGSVMLSKDMVSGNEALTTAIKFYENKGKVSDEEQKFFQNVYASFTTRMLVMDRKKFLELVCKA